MKVLALFLASLLVLVANLVSAEKHEVNAVDDREGNGRVGRDALNSFQQQIYKATFLDINNGTCPSPMPCVDDSYYVSCTRFCFYADQFQGIISSIQNCYVSGICGNQLLTNKLTDVNISITSGAYPGSCYIAGQKVTMSLSDQNATTILLTVPNTNESPSKVSEKLVYTFTGLNLHCQPTPPPPAPPPTATSSSSGMGGQNNCSCQNGGGMQSGNQNGGLPCCPHDFLAKMICLLQRLRRRLGLGRNLLRCDCNCGRLWFGERAAAADGSTGRSKRQQATAIDSAVTVTQTEFFNMTFLLESKGPFVSMSDNSADTVVSFGSEIPSQYKADIMAGVVSVFNEYNVYYTLQNNFYNTMKDLLYYIQNDLCYKCS